MQTLSQLAVRQAVDERHHHQPTPVCFQFLQAAMQRGAFGRADQAARGIRTSVLALLGFIAGDFAGLPADDVQRAIAHHADHPRLRPAPGGVIAARLLPDLQEGIVQRVRRECRLPRDP